jgi:thiamine transport system substrate-binding protein
MTHLRTTADGRACTRRFTQLTRVTLTAAAALTAAFVTAAASAQSVTLLTHESFALPEDTVAAFERDTGLELRVLTGGDAGETVNRALLTQDRPVADVLFGIDNALIGREGAADLFTPYEAAGLSSVPEGRQFAGLTVTPVTEGFVNFNLDLGAFSALGLDLPADLTDLTDPAYAGLTVVSDPATSSPGLAFMLATIDRFGEDGWLDYWAALRDNGLQVVSGWSDAYYTAFTRYGGDRPVVLSYATSPAAEVMFAEEALSEAPTVNLLCDRCAWRQIEAAGVLAGSGNEDAARQLVDFMLSPAVQAAVPEAMFVYPARSGVALPPEFDAFAPRPTAQQTASLPAGRVAEMQEVWLDAWTQVVRDGVSPEAVR